MDGQAVVYSLVLEPVERGFTRYPSWRQPSTEETQESGSLSSGSWVLAHGEILCYVLTYLLNFRLRNPFYILNI